MAFSEALTVNFQKLSEDLEGIFIQKSSSEPAQLAKQLSLKKIWHVDDPVNWSHVADKAIERIETDLH